MHKNYFYVALFLVTTLLKAQTPGSIPGHTLWLQPATFNDTIAKAKTKDLQVIAATHFNFNPVLDVAHAKKTVFKNIVEGQYSFFAVFKSDAEDEKTVFTISKGKSAILITNKEVLSDTDMAYKKVDSKKGIVVSFLTSVNRKGKKNNSIAIEDFLEGDKEGKQQLMEVIYYPRILHAPERQKVETYLSLKYGLSIAGEFDYTDSGNNKLWDYKKNKLYNNRVTGVGRDDALNLYQKQSGNADKDGLYIGLGIVDTTNAQNKFALQDKNFMLWGDNAGGTLLEKDKKNKDIKVMKRIWRMQPTLATYQDSLVTQLRISKKEMGITANEKDETLWLAVNDIPAAGRFNFGTAHYTHQAYEDKEYIYFNNIQWDLDGSGADLFTFVKGPDYFFEYDALANCSQDNPGILNINIAGGTAPYTISLQSDTVNQKFLSAGTTYQISSIPQGDYTLSVTDYTSNTKTATASVDAFAGIEISLKPIWYLNSNSEAAVTATLADNFIGELTYSWLQEGKVVATGKEFVAKAAGNYTLNLATAAGCAKQLPFTVAPNNAISGWGVYPNPAKSGQPFYIEFNLEKEAKVNLTINSIEGKLYLNKDLGLVKEYNYSDNIITAGVYLITVTIGDTVQTAKLIIH